VYNLTNRGSFMELKKLKIIGFKSVNGEVELLIDPRVTILIGANDHGKSNLLEAVRGLNDDRPITEEDVHWDLPTTKEPRIEWHFHCPEEVVEQIKTVIGTSKPEPAVPEPVPATAATIADPQEAVKTLVVAEKPVVEMFPKNSDNLLVLYREAVNSPIKISSAPIDVPTSMEQQVIALKPRVELFTPPSIELKDETTLAELKSDKNFEFMQGIFRLAEIWDDREKIFTVTDQTSRQLDEASARLTTVLNTTYNQGKDLVWKLKHSTGDKIKIEIQDPAISTRYTRPSLKSSGFRTYFLLSMITLARSQANPSNSYIYLFDEPGTNLHPRAQIDLQRSLEALSDNTQILYTTHSLFLLNKNYPDRNTVVTKTTNGTKINLKPFQKNWKAVRESLGILLSNNFLIADKTVFVEGPSDVIYLLHAIKTLKHLKKVDTDLNDLSIVDAGDESNYIALAKLMLQEGRNIFALLDGDSSGTSNISRLKKICASEIKKKQLEIKQLDNEKSSEDILTNLDILQQAILNVANNLVESGVRELKEGIDLSKEVKKIKSKTGITLGKIIDDTTPTWFKQEEKISKLSIALNYEDINDQSKISESAKELVSSIISGLSLRAEKAYEAGVFEEVDKV
jgi:predicted ATP-dependent endonuclease of OLD family